MPSSTELDLYLDESGTFEESELATVGGPTPTRRQVPSQLAGLLVKRGELTKEAAEAVLDKAFRDAGIELGPEVHGNSITGQDINRLIQGLIDGIERRGWQPVRLVNDAGLGFGDRVATYTQMVAELVLRIMEQKHRSGTSKGSIKIVAASVKLDPDEAGTTQIIQPGDYVKRIQDMFAFAAVRRGLPAEASSWRLDGFRLGWGTKWRELQLCDLISNASHTDFRRCDPGTKSRLREAFGPYAFTLRIIEVAEHASDLLQMDALGLSVRTLAEALSDPKTAPEVRTATAKLMHEIVGRLAAIGGPSRNAHLLELVSWLQQLVDVQRSLDLGLRIADWLRTEIAETLHRTLRKADQGSIDWFDFALARWALTAHNHRGDTVAAAGESERIDALLPHIAGRWEHATLMLDGLVAQAVHLTDSFDYEGVASRMRPVTVNYKILADLTHDALPGIFPDGVRSDLRARALGTWLQAEIYAGLSDSSRIAFARDLSNQAIDEFTDRADKQRQYQYRSQLEAIVGDLTTAREWLAKTWDLTDPSHEALGEVIHSLPEIAQGFALLHWTRIGRTAAIHSDPAELNAFLKAFDHSRLAHSEWCIATERYYPAHGIRRNVAVAFAAVNRYNEAQSMLGHLRGLNSIGQKQLTLVLVELAAMVEVAAFLRRENSKKARRLLDYNDPEKPGVKQLLARVRSAFSIQGAILERVLDGWEQAISDGLEPKGSTEDVKEGLLTLGRRVGY